MGKPVWSHVHTCYGEYIAITGERREVKHLSTCRRRKKRIDFLSSGERNGKSLNRELRLSGLRDCKKSFTESNRTIWEGRPKTVKVR